MTTKTSRPAKAGPTSKVGAPGGTKDSQQANRDAAPIGVAPAGADSRPATDPPTPNREPLGGSTSPHPTRVAPTPKVEPSDGVQLTRDQSGDDAHSASVTGDQHASGHEQVDAPGDIAAGAQLAGRHGGADTQCHDAVGSTSGPDPAASNGSLPIPLTLLDPAPVKPRRKRTGVETSDRTLVFAASVLDDIEAARIAMENRLRTLTRGGPADERIRKGKFKTVDELPPDKDGEERGWALEPEDPDVLLLTDVFQNLEAIESRVVKALERKMRNHRFADWVAANKGCGEKQIARLIGAVGDPYIRPEIQHDEEAPEPSRPRTVSELWAYCGLDPVDGVARRRKRGEKSRWSAKAKKNAWLVAASCKKQVAGKTAGTCVVGDDDYIKHSDGCACSPYRVMYDDARRYYADALHVHDCAQCKRDAGTPLKLGHQQARAMRKVAKEILKELWRESKRLHELSASQRRSDSQGSHAGGAKP